MVAKIRVNIGSGNGLLPDGTKPLCEPWMTYILNIHLRAISQEVLMNLICNMNLEITLLK